MKSLPTDPRPTHEGRMAQLLTGFKNLCGRMGDVILGANEDPTPTDWPSDASQQRVKPEVVAQQRPPSRLDMAIESIPSAIADFYYNVVRPQLQQVPGYVYRVDQVIVYRTPENAQIVDELGRMKREMRIPMLQKKFLEFPDLDASALYELRIESSSQGQDANAVFIASDGAQPVSIQFAFIGDFARQTVSASALAQPVVAPIPSVSPVPTPAPSRQATLMPEPPAPKQLKPSQIGTILPDGPDSWPETPPNVTLTITEPGHAPRQQTAYLPAKVGRDEGGQVVLLNPFVSRLHGVLLLDAQGQLCWEDHSSTGTVLKQTLVVKQALTPLAMGDTLQLVITTAESTSRLVIDAFHVPSHTVAKPTTEAADAIDTPNAHSPTIAQATMASLQGHSPQLQTAVAPLARLRVALADGTSTVHDVFHLPYRIGREIGGEGQQGLNLAPNHARVSRRHVQIVRSQAGVFEVVNEAYGSSGTWCQGERMAERFTLKPVTPEAKDGWCMLGERQLGPQSVAIRLEQV